ncbi:uncharacterized protein LOC104584225 [Brachypodium distachyon]|uniref:Prolamin-like domain-containing protein n=1 Tax=Brachypodium distachyon TaxID=15368 RepID=A0A2K2D1S8_BRADI|nr:uncharacterized protein LOC104584225 [Brachypodium distachyon]PNT68228.1 hypothetical protein BRADI_3g37488v3 [Brachypodium distachyon]|eukprot:XP_010236716.1 uncharacterized protein LOC104584225 [Brachypodium distachyon]
MASKCKITLLVLATQLLLAAAAPTATTPTTPTATPGRPAVPAAPFPPQPFPVNEGEAAAAECWKAVVQATETCAGDLLRRLASPEPAVRVGPACCGVLRSLGDKCLRDLFPGSPFGRFYAPFVARACGGGIPRSATTTTTGGRQ